MRINESKTYKVVCYDEFNNHINTMYDSGFTSLLDIVAMFEARNASRQRVRRMQITCDDECATYFVMRDATNPRYASRVKLLY